MELQLDPDALWRRRFQSSYIFYTQIASSNLSRGIISAKIEGETFQLYGWNTISNELRKLTSEAISVYFGWMTPDGKSVFYLKDDDGNEHGQLVQIDYESSKQITVTPDLPPFMLRGFNISKSGQVIAFNAVDETGFNYYRIRRESSDYLTEPHLLFKTKSETWDAHLSYDGLLLAVKSTARAEGKRNYSTLLFDMEGMQVAELWDGDDASVEPSRFSPIANDLRLLATTTRSGVRRPFIWDAANNERRELLISQLSGDIEPLDWSSDGKCVLLRQTYQAKISLHIYQLDKDELYSLAHPEGSFAGKRGAYSGGLSATYFGPLDDVWGQWSNSATPARLIVLDKITGEEKETKLSVSDAPSGRQEKSVSFISTDGMSVQGWLSVPAGDKPFPTIIDLHGGPHEHIVAGFDPFSQVWLDHGFAYFSINYRGSSGFGQPFQNQILGNIGHWELEDIVSARKWLIQTGISKPDEIILNGGSYGGYLVILNLARHPDLWRAGIATSTVVDWSMNYEDCSEATRGLTRSLFGGTPDDLPERYYSASPIHDAKQIHSPLLIFQARNDSRATQRQMERFYATMKKFDKPVEIKWLSSGHSMGNVAILQEQLIEKLKFVRDVLQDANSNRDFFIQ